jgi:hypothetical protein
LVRVDTPSEHGEELPFAWHASEFVLAAVSEDELGAG